MMKTAGFWTGVPLALAVGCGGGGGDGPGDPDGGGSGNIAGTAHIIRGASAPGSSTVTFTGLSPDDGDWRVSPNAARANLISLQFGLPGAGGDNAVVPLTDCTPEYRRDDPSFTTILDCPFEVPPGTYNGFGVSMVNSFEILLDDAVHGFYTDPAAPTHIAAAPPPGGATFVTVDNTDAQPTVGMNFAVYPPFVVDSQSSVTVTIAADMLQTLEVNVTGGVASFSGQIAPPLLLLGSPSGIGKLQFFSSLGTTDTYKWREPPINPDTLRVFYTGDGAASVAFSSPSQFFTGGSLTATLFAYAADPAGLPLDNLGNRAGGYLGADSTGTVCWAQGTDFTWEHYRGVYSLPAATTLGQSVTLSRDDIDPAPAPLTGETYASGCPTVTADETTSLVLAAQ